MRGPDWIKKLFGVSSDAGLHEDVMQLPHEDEVCMLDGKAIAVKYYPLRQPHHCLNEDVFVCSIYGEEIVREKIDKSTVIDTVVTFRVKDALGLESGIGAAFGKRSRHAD
jgi:hypothetical protein